MDQQEFRQLIEKYLDGNASPEEEQLLLNFFDSFQSDTAWNEELLGSKRLLEDKMLDRLQNTVDRSTADDRKVVRLFSFKRVAAAVIFLMVFSSAVYYGVYKMAKGRAAANNVAAVKHDVDPGGNKAILTLGDGSTYVLDSAKNGFLVKNDRIKIKKEKDGQIIYTVEGGKHTDEASLAYNTISTTIGGQYQVILADGTKVWLNASSSLKFPTAFKGNKRDVELTGEAYFEVAKNAAMPFNVNVNDMQVRVLGTHFNIMAYDNEVNIRTTLLEGAVKLTMGNKSDVLKPGQQGMVDKSGRIKVIEVDAEQAIAWKNGFFEFDRANIQDIMNQLSRWYGTNVTYEGKIPDDEFVGKISRAAKLSQVLHILEISHVHFKIENKNIIVTP